MSCGALWSRGRAVVSHLSALNVHDLGDISPTQIHLTVPPGFRATDPSVVIHKAVLRRKDVEDREGYQVTTVERTLLDVAAADVSQDRLNAALSEALERGLLSPRHFRARSDECGDRTALRVERALGAVISVSPLEGARKR